MNCPFCNKYTNNKLNFATLFSKNENQYCSNCQKFLSLTEETFENYKLNYFAKYEDIKNVIYDIKYFKDVEQAKKFEQLFAIYFKKNSFDLITIAPTNKTREAIRGFNHTEIVCYLCNIKFDNIFFSTYRPKQAKIHNTRELHKVIIKEQYIVKVQQAKTLLIIDDIFTSGKTMLSLAQAIKNINPTIEITFLTLAKA